MKVLIDIPEDYLNDIRKERQTTLWRYAIANGKALSYMTKGDMIKAMFPGAIFTDSMVEGYVCSIECHLIGRDTKRMYFDIDWWNAPYREEGEKDNG